MEKVILVNEKDEEIGEKDRILIDSQKDIVRVTALWIKNSEGQILLAQRCLKKLYLPGIWGPAAAGTLAAGESYESNIYKEAAEEINLVDHRFEAGPKYFFTTPNKRFCQMFTCSTNQPADHFAIQKNEVEQVKWFDPNELLNETMAHPENFTPATVKYCQENLNQ